MKDAPYRALGGFRFALAAAVVLSHTWFLSFTDRRFVQDLGIGNVAVMGFFVLSGFIISEAVDFFYRDRPAAFLSNRFLRLAPPYWVAAALSIAVHWALLNAWTLRLPDYSSNPSNMFDMRNLAVQITGIFPIFNVNQFLPREEWYYFVRFAWAIFVEFVFYYCVAICIALWPIARRIVGMRAYLASIAAGAIGLHVFSEYVRHLHTSFAFFPYFVLGTSIYLRKVYRDTLASGVMVVSYILIAIHFLRYTQGQLSLHVDWWSGAVRPVVFIPTLAMLAVPFLLAWISTIRLSANWIKLDQSLGDLTYPLYLNHYAVLVAAYSLFPEPNPIVQILTVAISIVASYVLQVLVEGPMSRLRDRIRGRRLVVPR
ncbi:Acyltransferase 3 [Rhodopseudomonas palustris HaA2]|uniref:Acyltransferase 3 n=1 Tax=Rhodopseudomonas palustris (strain HaA2) TaxID=316058 RepID=Q2IZV8_RHOP2|nr:acyltransferase [Rhodopseudomonas palustris]ABD06252.1 Acyltransferase 3 [Rhodopseudomonas palustris HaA2]